MPAYVLKKFRKNVSRKTTPTLDQIPIPSHTINSGASAVRGMPLSAMMIGSKTSASRFDHTWWSTERPLRRLSRPPPAVAAHRAEGGRQLGPVDAVEDRLFRVPDTLRRAAGSL